MNQLLNQPQSEIAPKTRYHRLRRKRRIAHSLGEIARLANELNRELAASDDGAPDAMIDHLSTAVLSLNACRLLLERRNRGV